MRMRTVLIIAVVLFLGACAPRILPRPVETETVSGEKVVKVEPQRTGNRKNVPAGVKPKDVAAHLKTKSGAEAWITKEGEVFMNEQAEEEGMTVDKPKRSRLWIWISIGVVIVLIILIAIDRVLKSYFGVNPLAWLCKRVRTLASWIRGKVTS